MPRNILDADDTKNCWNLSRMRLRSNAKSNPIKSIRTIMELCPGCSRNLGEVPPGPKPEDEGR